MPCPNRKSDQRDLAGLRGSLLDLVPALFAGDLFGDAAALDACRSTGDSHHAAEAVSSSLAVKFYAFFSPASMVGSLMRWYKLSGSTKSAEALTAATVNRLLDVFIADS